MDIYERQRLLGHGSFGEAFLVKSKINQKLYVIKSIRLSNSTSKNVSFFLVYISDLVDFTFRFLNDFNQFLFLFLRDFVRFSSIS